MPCTVLQHLFNLLPSFRSLGIEVVSETTEEELQAAEGEQPNLVAGVKVAYTVKQPVDEVRNLFVRVLARAF
jgi:hypothetical protein